ncbi:MAG: hypothetical protein JXQ99_29450 [Hyphomicrobiaceae bacterium]
MKKKITLFILLFAAIPASAQAKQCPIAKRPGCDIKGNINNKNVRLYHTPKHYGYVSVKITKCGERWFCSEKEAKEAGWQRASNYKPGLPYHDQKDFIVPPEAPPDCSIKGNVATGRKNRGVKRYHVVGSPRYAETVIRSENGDRWFCNVEQAQDAGFEKAGTFIGKTAPDVRDCLVPDDIPAEARRKSCFIKGNFSSSGKIFHVLGSRYYAETQITIQRGERWFCNENEAKQAGWRRPRRPGSQLTCGYASVRGGN